jgi:hypothetical protein
MDEMNDNVVPLRTRASERSIQMNLANHQRVEETAAFIAAELRTLLDRTNYDSHLSRQIREACPTYKKLTNIEHALARLRALAIVQADIIADIETMTWPDADDFDDADGDEAPADAGLRSTALEQALRRIGGVRMSCAAEEEREERH